MLKVYETAPGEIVVSNGHSRVVINNDELTEAELPILAGGFSGRGKLIHTTEVPMQVGQVYDVEQVRPVNLMVILDITNGYTYQYTAHKLNPHNAYWLSVGETEPMDTLPPGKYKILYLGA